MKTDQQARHSAPLRSRGFQISETVELVVDGHRTESGEKFLARYRHRSLERRANHLTFYLLDRMKIYTLASLPLLIILAALSGFKVDQAPHIVRSGFLFIGSATICSLYWWKRNYRQDKEVATALSRCQPLTPPS
ncbi:MAG: hypothetical protein Q7Q71_16315 [Verrucomicrobiota bacterium JB023]|nr:hypothetical protein [Verrucomicrobiota bacterium JB023]